MRGREAILWVLVSRVLLFPVGWEVLLGTSRNHLLESIASELLSLGTRKLLWPKSCHTPPPNSFIETLTLNVTVLGDRASLKFPLSHFVMN